MALSQEQIRNALTIYQVGRQRGLSLRDIQIALITAMTESSLINVHYGDRDSQGLFQQRPSQGWGTPEQVTNPVYAANKFYDALTKLGDRRYQMGMGQAAQAVQRSAYPGRYKDNLSAIRSIIPQLEQQAGEGPLDLDGNPYGSMPNQPTMNMSQLLGTEVSTAVPDASTMLGAWGMNAPQPEDPLTDGISTIIGPHTQDLVSPGGFGKGVDGWRAAVIQAAKSALGTPYSWGGTSLNNGVDCSGLVMAAFARAGIDMPRISYQQANFGSRVGRSGLQPGDLVAWDNSSRNNGADHIAIYLGNGMIIEAPRPGLSVRIRHIGKGLEGGWGVHLGF